uniref:Uncharacterized protein n=1 Tax=Mycena chlorophos TaxID=658473 RepID=A0ABQ0M0Y7_MYCCL|nr:predicted protein [Mycena chlorophos]
MVLASAVWCRITAAERVEAESHRIDRHKRSKRPQQSAPGFREDDQQRRGFSFLHRAMTARSRLNLARPPPRKPSQRRRAPRLHSSESSSARSEPTPPVGPLCFPTTVTGHGYESRRTSTTCLTASTAYRGLARSQKEGRLLLGAASEAGRSGIVARPSSNDTTHHSQDMRIYRALPRVNHETTHNQRSRQTSTCQARGRAGRVCCLTPNPPPTTFCVDDLVAVKDGNEDRGNASQTEGGIVGLGSQRIGRRTRRTTMPLDLPHYLRSVLAQDIEAQEAQELVLCLLLCLPSFDFADLHCCSPCGYYRFFLLMRTSSTILTVSLRCCLNALAWACAFLPTRSALPMDLPRLSSGFRSCYISLVYATYIIRVALVVSPTMPRASLFLGPTADSFPGSVVLLISVLSPLPTLALLWCPWAYNRPTGGSPSDCCAWSQLVYDAAAAEHGSEPRIGALGSWDVLWMWPKIT